LLGNFHEIPDREQNDYSEKLKDLGIDKAHYGCGPKLFDNGWANIDFASPGFEPTSVYFRANLASKHPFPSDFFWFSFTEDFIEHLDQYVEYGKSKYDELRNLDTRSDQTDLNIYAELRKRKIATYYSKSIVICGTIVRFPATVS